MNGLYDEWSVDKNKLFFEYLGPTKNVSFYKYMDSKELVNELKDSRIRFDDAKEKPKGLLKKNYWSKNRWKKLWARESSYQSLKILQI